jgi:hypothetical protein
MVDYVDYTVPMKTEVLVREKSAANDTPITRKVIGDAEPRVHGVMKVIIKTLRHSAARQELQKEVKKQGYSVAEFNAALQCLEKTTVYVGSAPQQESAPANASSPGSEYDLQTFDPSAAGARLVKELQEAEGGAWTGQELQGRFNLTPATLHRRRKEHRIIYWRDAQHEFHYPQWQFTPTGALQPGVQEILQIFRSDDEWRLMSYFLGQRGQLGDRRPLDLLRNGEKEKVLKHARVHTEENTW